MKHSSYAKIGLVLLIAAVISQFFVSVYTWVNLLGGALLFYLLAYTQLKNEVQNKTTMEENESTRTR